MRYGKCGDCSGDGDPFSLSFTFALMFRLALMIGGRYAESSVGQFVWPPWTHSVKESLRHGIWWKVSKYSAVDVRGNGIVIVNSNPGIVSLATDMRQKSCLTWSRVNLKTTLGKRNRNVYLKVAQFSCFTFSWLTWICLPSNSRGSQHELELAKEIWINVENSTKFILLSHIF